MLVHEVDNRALKMIKKRLHFSNKAIIVEFLYFSISPQKTMIYSFECICHWPHHPSHLLFWKSSRRALVWKLTWWSPGLCMIVPCIAASIGLRVHGLWVKRLGERLRLGNRILMDYRQVSSHACPFWHRRIHAATVWAHTHTRSYPHLQSRVHAFRHSRICTAKHLRSFASTGNARSRVVL